MRTFLHPSSMTNLKSLKRTRKTKNLSSHSTAVSSLSKLLNQMDRGMIVSMRSCQTAQAWADTDLLMVGLAVPTWQGITNPVPHCLLSSFTPSHQLQGKNIKLYKIYHQPTHLWEQETTFQLDQITAPSTAVKQVTSTANRCVYIHTLRCLAEFHSNMMLHFAPYSVFTLLLRHLLEPALGRGVSANHCLFSLLCIMFPSFFLPI